MWCEPQSSCLAATVAQSFIGVDCVTQRFNFVSYRLNVVGVKKNKCSLLSIGNKIRELLSNAVPHETILAGWRRDACRVVDQSGCQLKSNPATAQHTGSISLGLTRNSMVAHRGTTHKWAKRIFQLEEGQLRLVKHTKNWLQAAE